MRPSERGARSLGIPREEMNVLRLSKSKYLAGLQCPKRLYLEIHARELAPPLDESTQAILDTGTRCFAGRCHDRHFPTSGDSEAAPTEELHSEAFVKGGPAVSSMSRENPPLDADS